MQTQPEMVLGNIFIRVNVGEVGDVIDGHEHNFDHATLVQKGRVHIRAAYIFSQRECKGCGKIYEKRRKRADDPCPACCSTVTDQLSEREQLLAEREYAAPSYVLIKAEVEHKITFLEPSEFWCVYSHHDAQGRVTQIVDPLGAGKSYS